MLRLVLFLSFGLIKADSYLDAYKESHSTTTVKTDREYAEPSPGYPYPPPKYQYGPPTGPSGPSAPSGPSFMPVYGPPVYHPPAPVYGPPAPIYGPPVYGKPHAMLGLLDKLKFKLDLYTIGKILLKIVLFKKFVSFVAILCLLLFIPTLKHKVDDAVPEGGEDEDEDMRELQPNKIQDEVLNNITQFVLGAIESFSRNHTENANCDNIFCSTQKIVQGINDKLSYDKLARLYSEEVQS